MTPPDRTDLATASGHAVSGTPASAVGPTLAVAPFEPPAERPSRVLVSRPEPSVDGGRYTPKRTVGDTVAALGRRDPGRPRGPAGRAGPGRGPTGPPPTTSSSHVDAVVARRALGGHGHRRPTGPVDLGRAGLGRRAGLVAPRAGAQGRRPARTTCRASWPRAPCCSAGCAERAAAAGDAGAARSVARAAAVLADAASPDRPSGSPPPSPPSWPRSCDRPPRPRRRRAPSRAGPARGRPGAGPLRRLVRAVPPVLGRAGRRPPSPPGAGRAGLRRALPAADQPDRAHQPQGPQQHARGRPRRSRARRGPSATPPAATTPCTPSSGTVDDLVALAADARALGLELALDLAIQCSADHPWLTEHPEWFQRRPDGTLKYAENPPKKYQDIYNVDFDCDDWQGLWAGAPRRGAHLGRPRASRVFRVDNPHTKAIPFWEWLIAGVRADAPRGGVPGRGVHLPGDDAGAGQGRLQPGLHVLHLEAVGRTSWPSTSPSWPAPSGLLPAQLLREHPRHPHRAAPARRAEPRS